MAQKVAIRIQYDPKIGKNNIRITFEPLLTGLTEETFNKLSITQKHQQSIASEIGHALAAFLQQREAKTQADLSKQPTEGKLVS
jgi:hypothetical protein